MTRRELREHCFKILFCTEFHSDEEKEKQINQYFELLQEDESGDEGKEEIVHQIKADQQEREYLTGKVRAILSHLVELDQKINTVALGWKINRMGRVELSILRLALYEMLYEEGIPDKVSVNEAVEIAKTFGGKDAPAFINGILAKLI